MNVFLSTVKNHFLEKSSWWFIAIFVSWKQSSRKSPYNGLTLHNAGYHICLPLTELPMRTASASSVNKICPVRPWERTSARQVRRWSWRSSLTPLALRRRSLTTWKLLWYYSPVVGVWELEKDWESRQLCKHRFHSGVFGTDVEGSTVHGRWESQKETLSLLPDAHWPD